MKVKSIFLSAILVFASCATDTKKLDVIFDSDANNELDDQHAIAYLLSNQDFYNILAITTNATFNGGNAAEQATEAIRVAKLMGDYGKDVTIIPGATANFEKIRPTLNDTKYFDGHEAVDFIIKAAKEHSPKNKLVLIPVGKLTNIALALEKAPEIAQNVRIVWLGSNYPNPGEYNLENDIPSMNYVLDCDVETEFVLVHPEHGMTATAQVCISRREVKERIVGRGPQVSPVEGRQGGTFTCFGDYSLNLFDQCSTDDDYQRALFDMVAVATTHHPEWGESKEIPAPTMVDKQFVDRPDNKHKIKIWFNFDRDAFINDFIESLERTTKK